MMKVVTTSKLLFIIGGVIVLTLLILLAKQTPLSSKPALDTKPPSASRQAEKNRPALQISAQLYPQAKDYLQPGDIVMVAVPRHGPTNPVTSDDPRFKQAVDLLNSINKGEKGIKKAFILSAYDDVKNLISSIPSDVDIIGYNAEGGMTPAPTDGRTKPMVVADYAKVVHESGRQMSYGPYFSDLDELQKRGQLESVINSVDIIVYQGQIKYQKVTEDEFIKWVQEKQAYMKSINPQTKLSLQLWIGRETPEQITSAFNKLRGIVDIGIIGAPQQQMDQSIDVLRRFTK